MEVPMARHFLGYWKPATAESELARRGPFDHTASDQLWKLEDGDVLWIVTVRSGVLVLLGRLIVDRVCDQAKAARILRRKSLWDLWDADYHAIARKGTAEPLREVSLTRIADKLRFESSWNDRLQLKDGQVSPEQLQSMRRLSVDSAALIERAWSRTLLGRIKTALSRSS
jgi:hypothetical protein